MPFFSRRGGGNNYFNVGLVTGTSRGTPVTSAATANTKTVTPTQLVASTPYDCHELFVMFDDCATFVDYLVDILIGGAGSEVVLLSNLIVTGGTGSIVQGHYYKFHIPIPAGTRISVKSQATTLSSVLRVSLLCIGNDESADAPLGLVTTYGAATGDSGGTPVDPGGVANTLGAWAQITASTTYDARELYVGIGNQANGTRSSQSWHLELGVGGAGSEKTMGIITLNCSTSTDAVMPMSFGPIDCDIPAGSRLAARAQSDGIDATDRLFDVVLYATS